MAGDLNLTQLRAFYYAARCGSVTVAAEKLFITQPAVSMQIKSLESQYGVQLFVRGKKRIRLSETGVLLFRIAERIFGLVEEAEQVLVQSREPDPETLRIGSTKTLVRHLLAKYISHFQESSPRAQIRIDEGSSAAMVHSILEHRNDLAIVGRVPYHKRLRAIPFIRDELVLLAAPGHRLGRMEKVTPAELAKENLILREKGSGTRLVIDRYLESTGLVPSAFIETGNVDFIKEMVRIGDGITLLARMGVDEDLAKGDLTVVSLEEELPWLDIDIVFDKERPLSRIDEDFLAVLMGGHEAAGSSMCQDSV
ncbi:MAG: LysR substrate-binding domain-containing protein [Thermodesulfobacteriota bacterium]